MPEVSADPNIILIGMPGVGKSTVGVLLAKALSQGFLDTDIHIQSWECRRLQDILDNEGRDAFLSIEERYVLSLECTGMVIATGGSVPYSPHVMDYLKSSGVVVHLDLSFAALAKRINNLPTRGVVMAAGQTLESLYEERQPLYRQYADLTIDCQGLNHEEVVAAVLAALEG
jgi:shikimate kinase